MYKIYITCITYKSLVLQNTVKFARVQFNENFKTKQNRITNVQKKERFTQLNEKMPFIIRHALRRDGHYNELTSMQTATATIYCHK